MSPVRALGAHAVDVVPCATGCGVDDRRGSPPALGTCPATRARRAHLPFVWRAQVRVKASRLVFADGRLVGDAVAAEDGRTSLAHWRCRTDGPEKRVPFWAPVGLSASPTA